MGTKANEDKFSAFLKKLETQNKALKKIIKKNSSSKNNLLTNKKNKQ